MFFSIYLSRFTLFDKYNILISNEVYVEKDRLLRIAGGDEQAFYGLFKQYFASLVLYGERYHLSREDAEDTAMDVFGKLWKDREKMGEINYLPAFLYKVMRNACIDVWKKKKRDGLTEKAYSELAALENEDFMFLEAVRADVLKRIYEDIKALPDKYRAVFELTYYEGLNTRQIAERLGLSVTNVTSRRSRALLMLKKQLVKKDLLFLYFLLLQIK